MAAAGRSAGWRSRTIILPLYCPPQPPQRLAARAAPDKTPLVETGDDMATAATPMKSAAKGIASDARPFDWEDPFFLDDQLSEEEIAIRDAARDYCQERL